jgi:hypothetical protein
MEALIRLFGNICIFKQGPQDIPASLSFFIVILLTNFIVEVLLGIAFDSLAIAALLSLSSVFALFIYTWIWLSLFKLSNRFLQTASAFVGVSVFTNTVCFIPLIIIWKIGLIPSDSFALIYNLLLIWILSIYAHIYKNALNISFFLGLALAITFFITYYSIISYYSLGAN